MENAYRLSMKNNGDAFNTEALAYVLDMDNARSRKNVSLNDMST